MIKLDKDYIRCLVENAPQRKNASAWNKGVKNYAVDLIDGLPDAYCLICANQSELEECIKILKKLLLNGAENWRQYSYGGFAYIYDEEIAEALCNHSEFRKTKGRKAAKQLRDLVRCPSSSLVTGCVIDYISNKRCCLSIFNK